MSAHSATRSNAAPQLLLLPLLAFSLLAADLANAAICRVTTAGSGSGNSWAQAANLQSALSNSACDEVWVKQGSYNPGPLRTDSFSIKPGVEVYGGFVGNETARGQRNPATHLTTLSGEIGTPNDVSDNSYHVVFMDGTTSAGGITASTVLDGFSVSGGNADGSVGTDAAYGGGLYCAGNGAGHECSPTVANMTFSDNRAIGGGGAMYNKAAPSGVSSPILSNVVFNGNTTTAAYVSGGAMYNDGSNGGTSRPVLNNVVFNGNRAKKSGGAMFNSGSGGSGGNPVLNHVTFIDNEAELADGGAVFNDNSSPILTHVSFSGNSANNRGGAMHNAGGGTASRVSSPHLIDVIFTNNTARLGGAMSSDGQNSGTSSPVLTRVTFSENMARDQGGAMHNFAQFGGTSSPQMTDVTFNNNSAMLAGAMYNDGSHNGTSVPSMGHVTFSGNSASASAGAIYNDGRNNGVASPVISNSTFSNNSNPSEFGGAIYSYAGDGGTSSAQLSNVTFNGNSAALGGAIYNDGRSGGNVSPVLSNVILWGDTASSSGAEVFNDAGASISIGSSVVAGGCTSIIGATCQTGNTTANPNLGALGSNGGFTQTMLPGAGSSAIDAGNSTTCTSAPVSGLDQRGAVRPSGSGCDIGSVEAGAVIDAIFADGFE
ncbi:MAG TPA: choice-of-anchor Q domain-containing protein [Dokdonella sp.]|uniref:choice-of-anchor Q domain-containing protein n=1 Tax=Dokdonella sp. TaxID=2291710 RepID=UPI002D8111F5|nr:choice-of-anchor Q domain-containing protein [Dokdonella sp.]HET9033243.1 choice-of-anchor Q domain-containing protein [Dokdonella sp.]